MERRHRLVIFIFALILCVQLVLKGHGKPWDKGSVAFLRYTSQSVTIRLKGDVESPGIHNVPAGTTVAAVMEMTAVGNMTGQAGKTLSHRHLENGDVVMATINELQLAEITISSMGARERMLLGIPLEPNNMGIDDWYAIPGIGPVLARAIVAERQENGEFGSVRSLLRVPGIGEKQLRKIEKFF